MGGRHPSPCAYIISRTETRGSGGGGMGWMILVPLTVTRFMTSYREEFRGIPVLGFWW